MQITKITVRRYQKENSNLRAYVDVLVNEINIYGIRILKGSKGLFVSMPQREVEIDGKIEYFTNVKIADEARQEFNKAVLDEYFKVISAVKEEGEYE